LSVSERPSGYRPSDFLDTGVAGAWWLRLACRRRSAGRAKELAKGSTGAASGAVARCSWRRASYPGDGVTVGGAARTCATGTLASTNAAAANAPQNRFIRFLPARPRKVPPTSKIAPAHSHFKAGGESVSLTRQLSEHDPKSSPALGCGAGARINAAF